jgi:hypothetical protein
VLKDLSYFQEHIEWKGKYPIPKSSTISATSNFVMGEPIFQKTRDAWSFFYNELQKRDPVLANVYLTTFKHDSHGEFNETMAMFDIVAQIVKQKLASCGRHILSMPYTKSGEEVIVTTG